MGVLVEKAKPPKKPGPRITTELLRDLEARPRGYSFFQAVRILQAAQGGDTADIGSTAHVEEDLIRFRVNPSLGFQPGDVHDIKLKQSEPLAGVQERYDVMINFLGLHGTPTPLPIFYTEDSLQIDLAEEENPRRDFIDFFHHRFISLFYRTWEKYRYYLRYRHNASDTFSQHIFAYIGLVDPQQRGDTSLPWPRMLSYVGLMATRSRSPDIVGGVIAHCFNFKKVTIDQNIPRLVTIEERQRNKLGIANCTLGKDLYVGKRIPDISGKFRMNIHDIDFEHFTEFLPGSAGFDALKALTRLMLRDQLAYDANFLITEEAELPSIKLTENCKSRLGWSSWLGQPEAGIANVNLMYQD